MPQRIVDDLFEMISALDVEVEVGFLLLVGSYLTLRLLRKKII